MILNSDWRAFIESLDKHKVEYALVGSHAVAYHGHPRYTNDIDVLIRRSPQHATRIVSALAEFGFGSLGLHEEDFVDPSQVVQLGAPPFRIDIATSITGVEALGG